MFFEKRKNTEREAEVKQMTIQEIEEFLKPRNQGAKHSTPTSSVKIQVEVHKEEKPVVKNKRQIIAKARIKSQLEMV